MVVLYILIGISILLSIVTIVVCLKTRNKSEISQEDKNAIISSFNNNIDFISKSLAQTQKANNEAILQTIRAFQENLSGNNESLEKRVLELTKQLDERMQNISKLQEEKLEAIRVSNERHLRMLQEDNNRQLDKMRETVDEKLSRTINERFDQSFKVLSEQLESVYKSIGEMQNIATDVGSLTKMLSNVKTTGVFGEIQLGAIFDQLLTKDQYETNFVTGEGREPVEYVIKLPGLDEGDFVYLPVDSKFPFTVYSDLQSAYDKNDFEVVKQKKEQLKSTIKNMAKDINTKYICPPKTTNFAVMFLPVEGLYAEVAKMGLIEELQSKFSVTIAGPTTMSALLNSLQMGFRTLAIQKKSGEVWKILGAVRTEFDKFNGIIDSIRKRFEGASKDFDVLVGTRSRLIASKLRSVERLDNKETTKLLGLEDVQEEE
ncbi:MAG: DNA recombination protein RmuC [Clostridiales bacterium]|nr:DNA recombination protein RmuC [Clostridiales bacterium]